jgi:channel protein (hemolysin III family)
VVAIACKSIYFSTMPEWLGLSLYLGMGWIGLASGTALYRKYGFAFVAPILWGGLAYSIGAVLDHLKWPEPIPGAVRSHEVFHIAVLIGLAFHWSFIYSIADGRMSPIETEL